MSKNKTQPTGSSVDAFLDGIADPARKADCQHLRHLLERQSGEPAIMWGTSIVGFGRYHYRYASGREGHAPAVGFSPRASNITVYITGGFDDQAEALARLGKHTSGKGCLYIKRLADIDEDVLVQLIQASLAAARRFDVSMER